MVGPRRRLTPDQRRGELLDAAVRVLRQRGPSGCRVEDITAEAGTAKGNFYRYFPTWDDLLVAVRDHLLDAYADDITRRLGTLGEVDWWQVLEEEIDRFLEYQLEMEGLHDVVFHGPASQARPIDGEGSAGALVATLLHAGVVAGAFAEVDIGPTARLLFSVLHGAADQIREGADHTEVRAAAFLIFIRTLTPAPLSSPARATSSGPTKETTKTR